MSARIASSAPAASARPAGAGQPGAGPPRFVPAPINTIQDTGLNPLWLQDLALKVLYFRGYLTGFQVSEVLALPFVGIVDQILEFLKREKLVEVKGSGGFGEGAYVYGISGAGVDRAREALDRSQYAEAAPVPLAAYNEAIRRQSIARPLVHQRAMRQVLANLVLGEKTFSRIGPAINSSKSMFLYGPPGNGKTTVARAIGNMTLEEDLYIPRAIDIDGQVVKLYDSANHELPDDERGGPPGTGPLKSGSKSDPRWLRIKRPFIVTGGELTLAGLDLVYDDVNKYYEAPFQVKANGGMFLIDDFGRQQVRPRDLLNRWIVPLENRIDFLTLHTGRKVEVPFDVLVVFSTNLPPRDLVDEAFLRRIPHKIEIGDPTFEEYREIFKRVCEGKNIPYDERSLAYLLQEWYVKSNRKMRAVHPRDILDQILDIAKYLNVEPRMTKDLLDRACEAYFVDL